MTWTISGDLAEFDATAGEFTASDPVSNTIILAAAAALRASGPRLFGPVPPLFGWWRPPGGPVGGAFLHTPPYPILITKLPADEAAAELARDLADRGWQLPGITARETEAAPFAAAWSLRTGAWATRTGERRLFRLEALARPLPFPAGSARVAGDGDRRLLEEWSAAFGAEVGDPYTDAAADVSQRLGYGGLTLWERDELPVSLAGVTRRAAGVVRVGPVYTPPGDRGRGYAAAVTFSVSHAALAAGADEVVLFTDVANPTSNALYPRLGYRPVQDTVMITFQ
jgi:hypothetical protein